MTTPKKRPLHRILIAVLLVLGGLAALVSGIGAWMVSGCCGSSEPSEDGYLVVGALGAIVLWAGAYWVVTSARRGD